MSPELFNMYNRPQVTLYKLPWLLKKLVINPILSLITRYPLINERFNNI